MRALVYHGPGAKAWEEVPDPEIIADTDAIVRVDTTTICGTDLHILKGDVPVVTDGRILGHEAVGTVESVGRGVKTVKPGDRVLVSCITVCGRWSLLGARLVRCYWSGERDQGIQTRSYGSVRRTAHRAIGIREKRMGPSRRIYRN